MKKHYSFVLIIYLLLITSLVKGQSWNPDVSSLKQRKATEPTVGFGVAIPLNKLFHKRQKELPKQPETPNEAQAPEVVDHSDNGITASSLELYDIPFDEPSTPNKSDSLVDDQQGPGDVKQTDQCYRMILVRTWSDGFVEEIDLGVRCFGEDNGPQRQTGRGDGGSPSDPVEDCKRCKRYARAKMEIANQKLALARETYNAMKRDIEGRTGTDALASLGIGGGVFAIVNEAGSLSFFNPVSAAFMELTALLSGAGSGIYAFRELVNKAELDAANNFRAYQSAQLDWESAQIDFEKSLQDCGSCT